MTSKLAQWAQVHWLQTALLLAAILITLALVIRYWSKILSFSREVNVELKKCSWPWDPMQTGLRRYKELIDSTVVVIVSMVLLGAYTSFFDLILMKVVGLVIQLHI
ncbi:MAG: preprotein translocase subunit SecE [Verrucomicrobiae bacterium]|nr:preprotein translocase subunit SecE [Verrucomicrobiae bacterium]